MKTLRPLPCRSPLLRTAVAVLLCAASGCASPDPARTTAKRLAAAQTRSAEGARLADSAAQACPFPADIGQYEQTTLAPLVAETPPANAALVARVKSGCAILVFTLNDKGLVRTVRVVSADSAAFAEIAPKVLRWADFATGIDTSTEFMVRLGAATLPSGGAMLSLAFKDWTVNIEIPR